MKSENFSLLRNFKNSLNGLREVTANETPMRLEVYLLCIVGTALIFFPMELVYKLILFTSLLFPILAELLNSAVERSVDLVTGDYHELAKHAKDAASAAVLVAFVITGLIWLTVFIHLYY